MRKFDLSHWNPGNVKFRNVFSQIRDSIGRNFTYFDQNSYNGIVKLFPEKYPALGSKDNLWGLLSVNSKSATTKARYFESFCSTKSRICGDEKILCTDDDFQHQNPK